MLAAPHSQATQPSYSCMSAPMIPSVYSNRPRTRRPQSHNTFQDTSHTRTPASQHGSRGAGERHRLPSYQRTDLWAYATQTLINRSALGLPSHYEPDGSRCYKCDDQLFNLEHCSVMPKCSRGGRHHIDDLKMWHLTPVVSVRSLSCVALDCEMVLTTLGPELAQIVVIDGMTGARLLANHVRPRGEILDLVTRFSGITSASQLIGPNALRFDDVKPTLEALGMHARTFIIGHGLVNDFKAMRLRHEHHLIDTSMLYPDVRGRPQSLKMLAQQYLSLEVQTGNHDPEEDARSALLLMLKYDFCMAPLLSHVDGTFLEVARSHFGTPRRQSSFGDPRQGASIAAPWSLEHHL